MRTVFFRMRARVYDHPEEYKIGWVRGFYSVSSDNSGLDATRSKAGYYRTAETRRLYYEGYEDGRAAWNYGMRTGVVVTSDTRGRRMQLKETGQPWLEGWLRASTQKLLRVIHGLCNRRGL